MASLFYLFQAQPQGLPWYLWVVIALLVLGSLALIFVLYVRFKKTEGEVEEEWQSAHSLFVPAPERPAPAAAGEEVEENEDDIVAMRASLKPTALEGPAPVMPDEGAPATLAFTTSSAAEKSPFTEEPTGTLDSPAAPEPDLLEDTETQALTSQEVPIRPIDADTVALTSSAEPDSEPPIEPTRAFTSERRASRPTAMFDQQETRAFGEAPPISEPPVSEPARAETSEEEPPAADVRVSPPASRLPFEPPRIRPINKREPFEPPRIEPVRPREGGAPPVPPRVEERPPAPTREAAAPPPLAIETEPRHDAAFEEAAIAATREVDTAARPARAAAGSILGLPAEGSRGPLVLGEPVLDRQEAGIRSLSRYGRDEDEEEGRGAWSMIVLGIVVLLLGGFALAYAYIPGFRTRVTDFSARLRGLPPPSQQAPVVKPKVRLFASAFAEQGIVKARGFVDNVSDETLENLQVEVSLESSSGEKETRTVPVSPSPLAPFQRGQYEFQYDGKQFDSGYRVVRMTASSGEVGFTQPQR